LRAREENDPEEDVRAEPTMTEKAFTGRIREGGKGVRMKDIKGRQQVCGIVAGRMH
jgi:hypothetical protein